MILEIICAIFDISLVFLFFDRILKHRRNINSIFFYGSFILGETFIFLATELFGTDYSEIRIIITFTLNIFILISLSMLYNSSIKKRIFVSFNLQLYSMLSEYIVLIIISSFPSDISESLLSNQVYGAILSKIVTFILCTVTIIFYNKKRSSYNVQYSILILIMPVVSIILLITIPLRTDLTPLQSELSIIGIGGLLFANIINYYLLDNIIRVQELRRKESNLTNQINLQIDKYRQISEAYRNSRSIVHDVKKQYFYINECISKNDTGKLQEFINRSIIELEASAARVNTGNLVIDSFVSNHMTLAERSGIKFDTSLQIDLTMIEVPDYDLCIILGNLLDNSYKAAVAIEPPYDKRINVEIFNSSLELVIHIYNTVGPDVKDSYDDDEDEELYHGYGTTNVGRITRKYYGTYTHYIEKGWYHAIVSIPINPKRID